MRIEVEPKWTTPPSGQIADRVRFAIASGRLRPGDRLPSVRGLAADALVNPNTVAKAYRDLEREGTVDTRPGDGVFVASGAPAACRAYRGRIVATRLARAVEEALASGLQPDEVERSIARLLRRARAEATR